MVLDAVSTPAVAQLAAAAGVTLVDTGSIWGARTPSTLLREAAVRPGDGPEVAAVIKAWDASAIGYDEIDFYTNWAPLLPVRLPRMYGAHTTTQLGLLVLERLAVARRGDTTQPFDVADAVAIARLLATINRATVELLSDLPVPEAGRLHAPEWHDARRVAFVDRFGLPGDPVFRTLIVSSERLEAAALDLMGPAHPSLLHGDVQPDKIVFTASGESVLIDWSAVGWGAPALDLAALLMTGVRPEDYSLVATEYRLVADVTDDALHGALLARCLASTLGGALRPILSDRDIRIAWAGISRTTDAITWLSNARPDLLHSAGP